MGNAIVQIKGLSKVIKSKKIVSNLSFDIYEGEVFGFLGPNGAGKTTTIRMMVGLMGITEGDVIINGHSIKTNFEKAIENVGAIVENPELYKFLSGYDNLMQYARMVKGGVSKEKIDEVVELVGLTSAIRKKVKTYSLGMRQRLGLAQCLLHNPKILILDEPTNGLDPAGIREMRDYLQKLTKTQGMAVIVSSHLLSEMEMMCDRIAIIQNGELVDVQTVNELINDDTQSYILEVNEAEVAQKVLSKHNSEIVNGELQITLSREEVPDVIELLVQNGIRIYGIKVNMKTLEERFLEMTTV